MGRVVLPRAVAGHAGGVELLAMVVPVVVAVPEVELLSGRAAEPSCAWTLVAAEGDAEHPPEADQRCHD